MEPYASPSRPMTPGTPSVAMSPFVRQHSQGSEGGVVVRRRSLCFTPRSVSLPMTPSVVYSQDMSFRGSHVAPGFPVYKSGSMTIPAAVSVPQPQGNPHRTPRDALQCLQLGNSRFQKGIRRGPGPATVPFATIVASTDCPRIVETIFDAQPGSLVVTRAPACHINAESEGLLKKLEQSIQLGSSLILVLGHKECMTLLHASERFLASGEAQFPSLSQAAADMGMCADAHFVCERAMTLNVIQTIQVLLTSSGRLREQVQNGKVEIHGGMFEPLSGCVHFMGTIPGQAEFLVNAPTEKEKEGEKEGMEVPTELSDADKDRADSDVAATEKAAQCEALVEKAGDSQVSQLSHQTGTEGTVPGSEQSEPTSEDVETKGSGEDWPVAKDVKSLEPEDSQISESSTDAGSRRSSLMSQASEYSGHPDSFPIETLGRSSEVSQEQTVNEVEVDEVRQPEIGEGLSSVHENAVAKNEGQAENEVEKVILGPYFSVAFDIWMGVTRNPGLQLLRQNLLERLS